MDNKIVCEICEKRISRTNIKRHINTHYYCSQCNQYVNFKHHQFVHQSNNNNNNTDSKTLTVEWYPIILSQYQLSLVQHRQIVYNDPNIINNIKQTMTDILNQQCCCSIFESEQCICKKPKQKRIEFCIPYIIERNQADIVQLIKQTMLNYCDNIPIYRLKLESTSEQIKGHFYEREIVLYLPSSTN